MSTTLEDRLLPALLDAFEDRTRRQMPAPRRPRNRWMMAIPIVAAGLALAIVVPIVLPRGSGGADPAAAAALHRVALRAAAQPAVAPPKAGQFVYTKTESTQTSMYVTGNGPETNFLFTSPLTREAWIGTDGSGRIRETAGAVTFPTSGDRAAWEATGSPDLDGGRVTDHLYDAGELYYLDTTVLPDDPLALRDLIEQRQIVGGPKGDWETFSIVGDLLRETAVQPAVRGALYEVAADLPGVEYVGKIKDASGRPGIAVAYTHDGVRQEFIFDPQTAELLGEDYVLVEDSSVNVESGGAGSNYGMVGPAGTIAYTATYLASGITDSTNDRP